MQAMLLPSELSKNQIDRLGDRLRKGDISEADLRLLDSYRRSFGDGYEIVVSEIRDRLSLEPTGRPAKSTTSIIDKLQRESIRLSQMQDIAGCRLTVDDTTAQDEVVAQLTTLFEKVTIVDRRPNPSHGYRAVHFLVEQSGKLVEVQVRTLLQHLWAEVSEKLSDVIEKEIKYGGGPIEIAKPLAELSDKVENIESNERLLHVLLDLEGKVRVLMDSGKVSDELYQEGVSLTSRVENIRTKIVDERHGVIEIMKTLIVEITEI